MKQYSLKRVLGRCAIFVLFAATTICFYKVWAQTKGAEKEAALRPHNLKVLSEYNDGKGNTIRTVQYDVGMMRKTETIIQPRHVVQNLHIPLSGDTLNKDLLYVVVDKSKYTVQVVYRKRIVRMYKAVFGPHPLENKTMEGDRATPEGWFSILEKNPKSQYNKFMLLSYPNDSCYARFNQLKAAGKIPKAARIGGSVGIHGIWPRGDDLIELGVGWTDGCVAIKNVDADELFSFVSVGTKVHIIK